MSFGRDEYIYAVARIRYMETKLFSDKHIEQMISMPDKESLLRFLYEHGYGDETIGCDTERLIYLEREKLWNLIGELADDLSKFDFLRIQNDYHNLKAAVKAICTETSPEGLFVSGSKYSPWVIYETLNKKNYYALPREFSDVAQSAITELLRTGDGQMVDVMIDRACLENVYALGKKSKNEIIRYYCEVFVASADIKIAVRGATMSKSASFIGDAMANCESINADSLALSAAKSSDALCDYLSATVYRDAVPEIKKSLNSFEKWHDNRLMRIMKTQKSEPFSVGPLVAYVFAKEQEMKAVRLILKAKENSLSDSIIRERIREMYV